MCGIRTYVNKYIYKSIAYMFLAFLSVEDVLSRIIDNLEKVITSQ